LSFSEIALIVVIALVVFGPKKLPELSRTIGKALAEFRKASAELRSAMETEMRELERHTREMDQKQNAPAEESKALPAYDPSMQTNSNEPDTVEIPAHVEPHPQASDESSHAEVKSTDGDTKPA
jgi:TatA/E family protein of Tat protein translocase